MLQRGKASYILVEEAGPFFEISDWQSICTAAVLQQREVHTVRVALLAPQPVCIRVLEEVMQTRIDSFAFEEWGPGVVKSKRHARQLCQGGLIKLNGSLVCGRPYVTSGTHRVLSMMLVL